MTCTERGDSRVPTVIAEPEPPAPPLRADVFVLSPDGFHKGASSRRRLGRLVLILGLIVALAVAGLVFLLPRNGEADALAFRFAKGTVQHYRLQLSLEGSLEGGGVSQPLEMEMRQTFSMRTRSVDQGGVATVVLDVQDATAVLNGQSIPAPGDFEIELQIAPDGRILSGGGLSFAAGGSGGAAVPGADQFAPLLPDGRVSPGDTWTKEFELPFPLGEGTIHYTAENSLLEYEYKDGVRTAVIQSHISAPLDVTLDLSRLADITGESVPDAAAGAKIIYDGQSSFDMVAWVEPDRGELIKEVSTGTFDITLRFEGLPEELPGDVLFKGTFRGTLERIL